jgi:peptidoglycan-associated lipoprotein
MVTSRAAVAALLVCAACHHDKPAQTTPTPIPAQTHAAAPAPEPAAQSVPVSNNLNASDDLVRRCQLHFGNQQEAPKFDYDHIDLTNEDRNVLAQVADCITKGPLKGHKLSLVGRADPRGTEEYNLSLGDRRARTVEQYLEHLGVGSQLIDAKTRGALDASGRDDSSYGVDRRVDVDLD